MIAGFQAFSDSNGNLWIADGWVAQLRSGVRLAVGSGREFSPLLGAVRDTFLAAAATTGSTLVGGSGRGLVSSGVTGSGSGPALPVGLWVPTRPGVFVLGAFTLTVSGSSSATITDATNTVANLTTGGTAPVGSYAATSYGQSTYHGGTAFSVAVVAEEGAPGRLPTYACSVSAGTAQTGIYTPSTTVAAASVTDANWTVVVNSDGSADLKHSGTIMASRATGSSCESTGVYEANSAGMTAYNSGSPWRAFLQVIPAIVRAGFAYVTVTEIAGALTAVAGPYFATDLPADDSTTIHVPFAQSDGLGGLVQLHTGMLCWPGGNITTGMDSDALAYVSAVAIAKSSAVTTAQQAAISAFIVAEKAAGRWSSHKRLWLPIWNNAAANSIDIVTRATWTPHGTIALGAGYVTPDGTSGYVDLNCSASGLGLSNSSAGISVLVYSAASGSAEQNWLGTYDSSTQDIRFYSGGSAVVFECADWAGHFGPLLTRSSQTGVLTAMRYSGSHTIRQRLSAGVTATGTVSQAAAGTTPTANFFAMAYNQYGSPGGYCGGSLGAFGIHSGMSTSDTDGFSANLKTMWEACSGLTLP